MLNKRVLWTNAIGGLYERESKNLSYIPLPKPILLNFESTPIAGTIAKSIFFINPSEEPQLFILYAPILTGNLYFTILKLISSIKGT